MNDGMVQLNKVTKAYGSFQLDCSMEVQPGMATGHFRFCWGWCRRRRVR